VALGYERLEDTQQVEVEPVEIHRHHLRSKWQQWKRQIS
jgi:hypothetical protein